MYGYPIYKTVNATCKFSMADKRGASSADCCCSTAHFSLLNYGYSLLDYCTLPTK